MSKNIWFCSDHHFNHKNMLVFKGNDGVSPLRPFSSIEEHDEIIILNHNKTVQPNDKVYFLGDVDISHKGRSLHLVARMNGKKRLILGNHDLLTMDKYMAHFEKIMMWKEFREYNFVASHVPVRDDQIRPANGFNVHGHVHAKTLDSKRHKNVCMEAINYTPVHLDEILAWIKKNDDKRS